MSTPSAQSVSHQTMVTREAPFVHACDPTNAATSPRPVRNTPGLIEFLDADLNFIQLPAFRLDKGGGFLCRFDRLGDPQALSEQTKDAHPARCVAPELHAPLLEFVSQQFRAFSADARKNALRRELSWNTLVL